MTVPTCNGLLKWLRLNLGRDALSGLTGTDARALNAAAHILEAWACSRNDNLLEAFRIVVMTMQPKERQLAYHAPAYMGEWSHCAEVWVRAGLPALERVQKCKGDRS